MFTEWLKQEVSNQSLITDPMVHQLSCDLAHYNGAVQNHYWNGHGWCVACLHDWGAHQTAFQSVYCVTFMG